MVVRWPITLTSLPLHNKITLLLKRNCCPLLKPFESCSHCFWVPNSMSTQIIRISLMLSPILPPNVSYVGVCFWRNMVLGVCSITKKGLSILLLTCSVMFRPLAWKGRVHHPLFPHLLLLPILQLMGFTSITACCIMILSWLMASWCIQSLMCRDECPQTSKPFTNTNKLMGIVRHCP